MKAAIKRLLVVIALAVAKWVLKGTEYCVVPTLGIETAAYEANELLRYAEVSGSLGYRTHARSKVRNSAQKVLDALRLPPKPRLRPSKRLRREAARKGLTEALDVQVDPAAREKLETPANREQRIKQGGTT